MKQTAIYGLIALSILMSGCKEKNNRNPYLNEVSFRKEINTDLPRYSSLKYAGNAVYIPDGGIKGFFLFNTGNGYNAFEASDPNHYPSDCSRMQLNNQQVQCPCEGNTYNLLNGSPVNNNLDYPLKAYHVTVNGNTIIVYN